MDVSAKLLSVFQIDKQLRGLKSRLGAAERFLGEQTKSLGTLDAQRQQLESQVKQSLVQAGGSEGEMKRLDAKLAQIREQMNTSQTNKQYQAFLVEMNTYKTDRDKLETVALEHMGKVDELRKQIAEIESKRTEREQVQKVAQTDRDARHSEIAVRVNELEEQRKHFAAQVPADVLVKYGRLIEQRGEEAMGPIEVHDRKRHEYTCGVCQIALTIETVNGLLSSGKLTYCTSCQCVLYLDDEARKALQPPQKKSS